MKRVYRELNVENLRNNVEEINRYKHKETEIMAIVKANAYGHGAIEVSHYLESMNIKSFGVATLIEALELRASGIQSEILILGYTALDDLKSVIKHDLIQTIVDYDYAQAIHKLDLDHKVKCHIKINTGMNRLGESYNNIEKIKEMYLMEHLDIMGIFSHLAVADSQNDEDIDFTKKQINRFKNCLMQLSNEAIDYGKAHLQGSYGFTNYPHLKFDYIRMGIMLYGHKSSIEDYCPLALKPVMSLKSHIAAVRTIESNESVSYGRVFTSDKKRKIATVTIGYADGLSRTLSNGNYEVMIQKTRCRQIGRICMDQMMVDVSHLDNVSFGEEVVIFNEDLKVEEIAKLQNSITNEVLTSLTARIE